MLTLAQVTYFVHQCEPNHGDCKTEFETVRCSTSKNPMYKKLRDLEFFIRGQCKIHRMQVFNDLDFRCCRSHLTVLILSFKPLVEFHTFRVFNLKFCVLIVIHIYLHRLLYMLLEVFLELTDQKIKFYLVRKRRNALSA